MKKTFADTYFFLALLNPRDAAHELAIKASAALEGRIYTTEFVLLEVGDAMADPDDRPRFMGLMDTLNESSTQIIIPASTEWLHRGYVLYQKSKDKGWSLTDCISFAVMKSMNIQVALTGDRHFKQAGFTSYFT